MGHKAWPGRSGPQAQRGHPVRWVPPALLAPKGWRAQSARLDLQAHKGLLALAGLRVLRVQQGQLASREPLVWWALPGQLVPSVPSVPRGSLARWAAHRQGSIC